MDRIKSAEQIIIFSRYIGQQVVINSLLDNGEETIGTLIGIKENALLVKIHAVNRWIPLNDEIQFCDIKLILKPLKRLTPAIIATANSLPVQAFITPYYQSLGFDMPVYISPGHSENCKYVHELDLADYRTIEDILQQNESLLVIPV
jgi:hypothetical protein